MRDMTISSTCILAGLAMLLLEKTHWSRRAIMPGRLQFPLRKAAQGLDQLRSMHLYAVTQCNERQCGIGLGLDSHASASRKVIPNTSRRQQALLKHCAGSRCGPHSIESSICRPGHAGQSLVSQLMLPGSLHIQAGRKCICKQAGVRVYLYEWRLAGCTIPSRGKHDVHLL